jgi:hypothetical protein
MLLIHAVTMGLLLAGMFGLSMVAMELSKETTVGAQGALVTTAGEAVSVASSDMYVGPEGELRQRRDVDGRRLDGEDGALIQVSGAPVMLGLTVDGPGDGADRRLAAKWGLRGLTYPAALKFLRDMKRGGAGGASQFAIEVVGDDGSDVVAAALLNYGMKPKRGRVWAKGFLMTSYPYPSFFVTCQRLALLSADGVELVDAPCSLFLKRGEAELIDTEVLCMKKGECHGEEWHQLHVDYDEGAGAPAPAPIYLDDHSTSHTMPEWWTAEDGAAVR